MFSFTNLTADIDNSRLNWRLYKILLTNAGNGDNFDKHIQFFEEKNSNLIKIILFKAILWLK